MSINNVSAVSDALKYLKGQEIVAKDTSVLSPVKEAVTSPANLVFAVGPSKRAIKDVYQTAGLNAADGGKVKFLDAFKYLTDKDKVVINKDTHMVELLVNGEAKATNISVSKSLKEQIKHAANQLAESGASKKAAEEVAQEAGKKGFFSAIKGGLKTAKGAVKTAASKVPVVSKLVDGTAKEAVKGGVKKVAGETGVKALSKAKGIFKGSGAGFVAVIDGGIETVTQVIPAFKQGGVKAGAKQIAKSGVKVAAGAGGWAAGAAVGKGVGAWLGGIIGGLFGAGAGAAPGAAIGGAIGNFLGGIIGSGVASKAAQKVTGKSEVEKIQEKNTDDQAQQIANDPEQMKQLKAMLEEQINADIQSGNVTENTEIMANYLNSGAFGSNYSTPTYEAPTTTTKPATDKTSWLNEEYEKIKNGTQNTTPTTLSFAGANSSKPINFYG